MHILIFHYRHARHEVLVGPIGKLPRADTEEETLRVVVPDLRPGTIEQATVWLSNREGNADDEAFEIIATDIGDRVEAVFREPLTQL